MKTNGQVKLKPKDFAKHWWIRRDRPLVGSTRILEPIPIVKNSKKKKQKKDSHRRNHGVSGTGREPTFSERVDMNNPAPMASVSAGLSTVLPSMQTMLESHAWTEETTA